MRSCGFPKDTKGKWLLWGAVIVTLVGTVILGFLFDPRGLLRTSSAPLGMINLELAFTEENARSIIASWHKVTGGIEQAKFGVLLDFLPFIPLYTICLALWCYIACRIYFDRASRLANFGIWLLWAQLLVAILDIVETILISSMLSSRTPLTHPLPAVVSGFSVAKWALIALSLLYILLSWFYLVLKRRRNVQTEPPDTSKLEDLEIHQKKAGVEGLPPRLGVLLVHGIGDQKRGETVPWAGDPLFKWFRSWLTGKPRAFDCGSDVSTADAGTEGKSLTGLPYHCAYLSDARMVRPIPGEGDAPPYTRMYFQTKKGKISPEDPHWILAESHWAQEFAAPTYGQIVRWGLGVAPVLIEQTGTRILLKELPDLIRKRVSRMRETIPRWLKVTVAGPLAAVIVGLVTILGYPLLFVSGLLAQVVLLLVSVLGFIPPLQGLVVKIQTSLANGFGDAYLAAANEVQLEAMISQIRRDIEWLAGKGELQGKCEEIAVIAHSGGTEISYQALTQAWPTRETSLDKCILFVSYGTAISKIDKLRKLWQERDALFWLTIGRLLSLVPVVVALIGLMQENIAGTAWEPIIIGSAELGVVLQLVMWRLGHRYVEQKGEQFHPVMPHNVNWIDYAAPLDIVPDEDLKARVSGTNRLVPITVRVNNLHSILKDHDWFWNNDEEYIGDVARLLFAQAFKRDLAPDDSRDSKRNLEIAWSRRYNKVHRYFGWGLALLFCVPVIWVLSWPLLLTVGESIRSLLVNLVWSLSGKMVSVDTSVDIQKQFWAAGFGMLATGLVIAQINQLLLFQTWSWWSRMEKEAMFSRELFGGEKDRAAEWRLPANIFLSITAVVPWGIFVWALLDLFYSGTGGAWLWVRVVALAVVFLVAIVNSIYAGWAWYHLEVEIALDPRERFVELLQKLLKSRKSSTSSGRVVTYRVRRPNAE
ncbi:MAG TPA: hypothetical protein VJ183_06675 [Chloroflexia bacterium]|nr:hypothetical protein [Chloroflexia bacterium]